MSASEWYKRQKDKLKRALGAPDQSSISLPNSSYAQPPSSPAPQSVTEPANDGLKTAPKARTSGQGSEGGASEPSSKPRPVETGVSKTSAASWSDLDAGRTLVTVGDKTSVTIHEPRPEGTKSFEPRVKRMEWLGLKTLLGVIRSSDHTFGPLESAFGGLEHSIEQFLRTSKTRDDYKELGEKLDELLGDLAEFNNSWMGVKMTASVKKLCRGIEAETKAIEQNQGRSTPERYIEETEDSDAIFECYRRIHEHVERLTLNANLNMWKTPDEEMTDRLLLQLSPTMSGAYNSCASRRPNRRTCTEGTRLPQLKRLKEWARNPSTSPIYWINGAAGTGKTTIAYTLCSELETTGELAASFFCTRLIPECRDVQFIIPAIAYQLAQFSLPFRHALSRTLGSDHVAHTRELKLQFQTLIVQPLKAVRHTMPSGFVVAIDALDECEDSNSVGKILDLLVTSTPNLPVRFLISSRPEPEIYDRIMNQVTGIAGAKLVLHELDPNEVHHDITSYLRQELHAIPLTTAQWNGLSERCGALFIYASTACRYIKSGDETMGYEAALDTVLGISVEDTGNMETGLEKLYMAILEAAFTNPRISEVNRKRMKALLDTIICGQEPMTTETLAALLQLENTEHASTLLRPLFSVVDVSQEAEIATTLHASFPEFLFSDRSGGFHCAATEHHIALTLACLERIRSNPVQFNICGIESSYTLDRMIVDLPARASRAVSPALYYSCLYWASHLELGGPSIAFREPVLDFLSARLLFWLEIQNTMGCSQFAIYDTLNKLENWCRAARMPKDAIELALDARIYCTTFGTTEVSESTAHIYTSLLAFWPSDSLIAKHYIPRTTGMIQPRGTAITNRYLPRLANRDMGEPILAVSYSSTGAHIVTAVGNDVYILDGRTLQTVLGPLEGHSDLIVSIAVSLDGSFIASGSYDATIRIWSTHTGTLVTGPIKADRDRVTSVAFSPDSKRIASAGAYDALRIWSVESGEQFISMVPSKETPNCIGPTIFSADGSCIISGGDHNTIYFWDARTGNPISHRVTEHTAPITSIALSSDGFRFVSASADGTLCVWDTDSKQVTLGPLKTRCAEITQVAFSPNDLYIATGDSDSWIHLWDTRSGGSVATLYPPHGYPICSFAFSPDSSHLVFSTGKENIAILDVQYAVKFDAIVGKDRKGIHSACFSSDGSQIVTGGRGGSICLWDSSSGELVLGPLTGHKGYICSVAISSDGAYIASASRDKTIRLWDIKGGKGIYKVLEHHTKGPGSLTFSLDGLELLYGSLVYPIGTSPFVLESAPSPDTDVRDIWAGEVLSHNVSCIATSPDGLYVASGSADGTIRIWHAQTGQLLMEPLVGHTEPISVMMFSPNGAHVVSCSLDDTIRFWRIPGKPSGKIVGSQSTDSSKEIRKLTSRIMTWKLNRDGWIINDRKEYLAWVPRNLRPYLVLPQNDLLISHKGSFEIDFTDTNIGKEWAKCYCPP